MEQKVKTGVQIFAVIALWLIAYFGFSEDGTTQSYLYEIGLGLSLALIISGVVTFVVNLKFIWRIMRTHLPWSYRKPIRLTIAYLFRIHIDGKYILIRNKRNIHGYQPVGGVYKYLREENADFFDGIGLIDDTNIERDAIAEDDLRMELRMRYKLLSFIKWFNKRKHRETDPWREFYEELVKPEILSHQNFPHIQYRYVKQHAELEYSDFHHVLEYKVADIYELRFANQAQKDEIRRLIRNGHPDILAVTADEIKECKQADKNILEHTYKIV